MTKSFHAPVTSFTMCLPETMEAIENLLTAFGEEACLRIDIYVADTDRTFMIKDGVTFFRLDQSGDASHLADRDMSGEARQAFLEVLSRVNDDVMISESISAYPLPWHDGMFCDSQEGRHLSVLFFKDGVGAVIQEYLPTWFGEPPEDAYFDADAETRSQIMSVFTSEVSANHQRLQLEAKIAEHHQMIAAMFRHHCDNDIDADLSPIDPSDRI